MTPKIIGALNKSDTAEVRVTTNTYKGRSVVDIRVWYMPDGGHDFVPSRKGITIDNRKVKSLIEVLSGAL